MKILHSHQHCWLTQRCQKMVANDFFGHYDAPQLTSTKFLGTKTPQYGVKAQRYVTEPPQIHSSSGMCLSTNNESLHIGDAHWNGLHFHNAWGTPLEKLQKILKTSSLIDKKICKYATTWLQKRKYMGSTVFPWNQEPKRLWQITTFAVKWIMFRFVLKHKSTIHYSTTFFVSWLSRDKGELGMN